MGDTMLVNMTNMLKSAKEYKYAVAQFNINNLEWTRFILEANQELGVPVILGVSEGASKYMGGYITIVNMVKNLIDYLNITIDVVIHLDHGSSFESCKDAIDAGFTSVMIDASKYNLEENIEITKRVVDYAKQYNVSVEAEIGHIGGTEDGVIKEIKYADPVECVRFCRETNIDCLAPALGSVHGPYKGDPKLEFNLMEEIKNKCDIPLVLHGGSGIYDSQIRKAIECGICKININTELQQVWSKAVREKLEIDKVLYDPRKIIKAGEMNIKNMIKEKVELFKTHKCV